LICTSCNGGPSAHPGLAVSAMAISATPAPVYSGSVAVRTDVPRIATAPSAAALLASAPATSRVPAASGPSKLQVKRLVVATGVHDREPLVSSEPLPSDGTAIYAFAELVNLEGESENVRVTFERKGGKERVGDVTLPVPGKVSRHRTWAFTRFVRAPGVWEAVLWSESGAELGRTSFEVKAS